MIFFFLVSSWGTYLLSFFTFPIFFKCWMMLEWSMLSSSAASCIVERGSALIIALSWSLSTSSSQLLCWSSNALATWCEELTHLEKTLMLGRIEGRRRRGRQRMRWHHWLDGHEFEQAPGVGDGQGSLVYCSPWGCKESDTTEWLNWTEEEIRRDLVFHWLQWVACFWVRKSSRWACELWCWGTHAWEPSLQSFATPFWLSFRLLISAFLPPFWSGSFLETITDQF